MAAAITVDSLDLSFRNETVLRDVDLTVEEGEFCVIMGPSGSGKSMLLKSIVGLETPDSGDVFLNGENASRLSVADRDVGFVFQEFEETLFPHRSVGENIAFGLERQGVDADEIERRTDEMLELLAIAHTKDDAPPELSGGQQQRVELARQLVRRCDTMLLDDPLADLDYKLQKRMEIEMRRIHADLESAFVYVTHNQDQALKLADKLVILNGGRVEQIGTPSEVYHQPASAFVARFAGDSNAFKTTVTGTTGDAVRLDTDVGEMLATPMHGSGVDATGIATVRPENVAIGEDAADADNTFEATPAGSTYMGEETEMAVEIPGLSRQLLATEPGQRTLPDSETVLVGWNAADTQFFEKLSVTDTVQIDDLLEI
ncbi:ABC transporter ATP-binding protein [Natronomonas sp.]|uniref:ABC transporter ATP-binding protein n=1 Tax=Natronomonas sp. TaxID=2184060 RepID=UPI00263454FB|nr:ABC transporter ATP-binding protein [Natronomonas sp.]